jgi:hypothetical protein
MNLRNAAQEAERKGPANMLQLIRTRFTSGRPRKVPTEMLGPMFAVLTANIECNRIVDFIREKEGSPEEFAIQVFVVTVRDHGPEENRGHSYEVPASLDEIIALADKLKKMDLLYAGMLVAVHDRKTGNMLRYMRPFIVSPEASEILSLAALKHQFLKGAN